MIRKWIERWTAVLMIVGALWMALPLAAQAAPTEQPGQCAQTHQVQRGENLFRIAKRYGTTYQVLMQRNGIVNPNRIYVGQRLCVQAVAASVVEPTGVRDIVALTTVRIRTGPGTNYPMIGRVYAGEGASVNGISPDHRWWRIACGHDIYGNCWVSADPNHTRPASQPAPQPNPGHDGLFPVSQTGVRYVQAQSPVRLRSGPGTQFDVIGRVEAGQFALVTGLSLDGGWWRVICPNDTVGNCFVSADPALTRATSGF